MPFLLKAVVVIVRAFFHEVALLPSRVAGAVALAHLEHARHKVVQALMRPNWDDHVDKAYLLACVIKAERVTLVDWNYEWESAHVYAPGAETPLVIQLVGETYRACDLAAVPT